MTYEKILKQLLDCESKIAIQDELLGVVEQAMELIPTGQLAQGYTWIPSSEAVILIALAKNRIKEHKELLKVLFEDE